MRWFIILAILLAIVPPTAALAQSAPLTYGPRIPAKIQGWFAPVGSNLIGSDEKDHARRGAVISWDWSTALGSPVFAIGPGSVSYAGCNDRGHYGCWIQVNHGNGYTSDSAHCMEGSIRVQQGQQVDASTQICNIGRTGWTSWPHVHLAIKKDGAPLNVSDFFDVRLIHYCFWTKCRANHSPNSPVTFGNNTWVGQTATNVIAETFNNQLAGIVFLVCFLLFLMSNKIIRYGLYIALSMYAAVLTALPRQTALAASPMVSSGSAGWEQVYPILQSNEGWSCTEDGAHTLGGVTQGTYDAWRMGQGVGPADVCLNLTRAQAKAIYYERYWLASGANYLPIALALTHVDMAINAGVGMARSILARCGNNVACYNATRVIEYQSMRSCSLYCQAWINRVNKIRRYTGG